MGTTIIGIGRDKSREEIRRFLQDEVGHEFPIRSFGYGVAWAINDGSKNPKLKNYIVAIKWSHSRLSGEISIKFIEEDMGPCYYGIPLKYVDAPCELSSQMALQWREKVRHYHRRNNELRRQVKDIEPGDIIMTTANRVYIFQRFLKTSIIGVHPGGHIPYRIPVTRIEEIVPLARHLEEI